MWLISEHSWEFGSQQEYRNCTAVLDHSIHNVLKWDLTLYNIIHVIKLTVTLLHIQLATQKSNFMQHLILKMHRMSHATKLIA